METGKFFTAFLLLALARPAAFAQLQTTDTLEVAEDAMIRSVAGIGDNTNYADYGYTHMQAWTNLGDATIKRSLITFDLSALPAGATLLDATLYLYADSNSTKYPNGHDQTDGSNAGLVRRVIDDWAESTATWNNQPGATVANQVTIPATTSSFQHQVLDVTALVQDMLDDPSNSFGFMLQLQEESPYRRMVFASHDHANPDLHPKLVVTYDTPSWIYENDPRPGVFSLYPNPAKDRTLLTFENTEGRNHVLTLFDMQGKAVRTTAFGSGQVMIEKGDLESGLYFFQVSAGEKAPVHGRLIFE